MSISRPMPLYKISTLLSSFTLFFDCKNPNVFSARPLPVFPLSFSISYPSFWSPKTSVHLLYKLSVKSHCCLSTALSLPPSVPTSLLAKLTCYCEEWAGFTCSSALMLLSRWSASQPLSHTGSSCTVSQPKLELLGLRSLFYSLIPPPPLSVSPSLFLSPSQSTYPAQLRQQAGVQG